MHRNDCQVAVVGAGPYGLATAAHLKSARVATSVFGETMSFWERHMPDGMKLRSPWAASHIAHPDEAYSLEAYAAMRGFAPHEQMAIGEFIRYGRWFQSQAVPDVDPRKVTRVERYEGGFRLRLADGDQVRTERVVIAMGLAHQEHRPAAFTGLPQALVSHTCENVSFARFRGQRVAVVGRGQSACESAALLSEAGAEVELISRGEVLWLGNDTKGAQDSDLAWQFRRLLMTRGAVGPFPWNWLVEVPALVHLFPEPLRAAFSTRCLRPKASGWLHPRFANVRISAGRRIGAARAAGNQVELHLDTGVRTFDHVVLGTGYDIDIAKLGILAPALLAEIACSGGAPRLAAGMESNVTGLHFVGATAVHSFGPLMRFVWGAGFAAGAVTRRVLSHRTQPRAASAPGMQVVARPRSVTRL